MRGPRTPDSSRATSQGRVWAILFLAFLLVSYGAPTPTPRRNIALPATSTPTPPLPGSANCLPPQEMTSVSSPSADAIAGVQFSRPYPGVDFNFPMFFSPDGRWLALGSTSYIFVFDAATLTPRMRCPT